MNAEKRGRKPIPEDERRVPINARVKPETKRKIESTAKLRNLSVGRLLDLVFSVPLNFLPQ